MRHFMELKTRALANGELENVGKHSKSMVH
jgi:hypothetical protein